MGRGRAPCCDKSKVKRGPWSPSEDSKLISFIRQHGHSNWRALPKLAGLSRCGKSCRLRWINYLRPDVKRGNFTKDEEETIIKLHKSLGNKWSKIASHLPGRTDNEIKNVWNTHLKKKLSAFSGSVDSNGEESIRESSLTSSSSSYSSPYSFTRDRGMETNNEVQEDVPGRAKSSSSSSLSHGSNVSNVSNETKDRVDDKVELIAGFMEEVNKPDTVMGGDLLEIPFEFDTDFWNMFDSLDTWPLQATQIDQLLEVDVYRDTGTCPVQATQIDQLLEVDVYRDTGSGDRGIGGGSVENEKWLRYLENELGLVEPTIEDGDPKHPKDASQPLNSS